MNRVASRRAKRSDKYYGGGENCLYKTHGRREHINKSYKLYG